MSRPNLFRRSLAARLALILGLVSVSIVTLMGLGIYFFTARYLTGRAEDDLAALADFYAAYTASAATDQARLALLAPQIASFFAPQAGYDVRLFDADSGTLLAATHDMGLWPSGVARSLLGYQRIAFLAIGSADQPGRIYAARSVLAPDGSLLAVVEVSRRLDDVQAFLNTLRLVVLAAGGVTLAVALLASALLARGLTRPLRDIESATRTIAGGDFSRRLLVTSQNEVGRLAASINLMAADLARLEATRREFIARISHDLRTPLTAIKGLVINLQDSAPEDMQPSLATIDEQTDRLVRLVNDLLTLSQVQRGELRLRRTRLDLGQIARSTVALVGEKAARLGVSLRLDLPPTLPAVSGDADRLQQVTVNLLDNALKVTPAGGAIHVRVSGGEDGVSLTVTDTGRGLSDLEQAHAFEAYFSGMGGSTGLGLTIAREIVVAHGGRIWLKNRPGGGAEAGFTLPV